MVINVAVGVAIKMSVDRCLGGVRSTIQMSTAGGAVQGLDRSTLPRSILKLTVEAHDANVK